MADIIIGRAKVIGVQEVALNSSISDPGMLVQAQKKPKTTVISQLKIEPAGKTEGFTSIEGTMTIPAQLPFGKLYELTLHETEILPEGARLFKDGDDD